MAVGRLHLHALGRSRWCAIRKILDAVESLIGPDILVYTSTFFIKEPHSPTFAAWHQDATYFGLTPHEHVTAWVALTDATAEAGCMEVVSSRGAPRQLRHAALGLADSINGGGQAIVEAFDEARRRGDGVAGRQFLAAPHAVPPPLGAQSGVASPGRAGDQLYPGAPSARSAPIDCRHCSSGAATAAAISIFCPRPTASSVRRSSSATSASIAAIARTTPSRPSGTSAASRLLDRRAGADDGS